MPNNPLIAAASLPPMGPVGQVGNLPSAAASLPPVGQVDNLPVLDLPATIAAADLLAASLLDSGLPDQVVATWLLPVYVHLVGQIANLPIPPLTARLAAIVGLEFPPPSRDLSS